MLTFTSSISFADRPPSGFAAEEIRSALAKRNEAAQRTMIWFEDFFSRKTSCRIAKVAI